MCLVPQPQGSSLFYGQTSGLTDLKACMFITAEMSSYTDTALCSTFQGAHLNIVLVMGGFQCL